MSMAFSRPTLAMISFIMLFLSMDFIRTLVSDFVPDWQEPFGPTP